MRWLSIPELVLVPLFSGGRLFPITSRAGPGPHHAWPLAVMGVGLLLALVALAVRVGLYDRGHLAFHRGTRLTLLGGLTVGTTLALLGLLAALSTLL